MGELIRGAVENLPLVAFAVVFFGLFGFVAWRQRPGRPREVVVTTGTARLLPWRAEVDEDLRAPNRRSRQQYTRITFPSVKAAPGRFLLVMVLPREVRVPDVGGSGFLAEVAARAAEAFLDLYVGAYFGAAHRALVNLAGAERPAAPEGLWALSTDPALAARLLRPELGPLHRALAEVVPGGVGCGLLATGEGITFAFPVGLGAPAAVHEAAGRVGALLERARA